MGRIHEAVRRIEAVIAEKGLEPARTRGLISQEMGFAVGLISEDTPDDPALLEALLDAAEAVLGVRIDA